jgi:hypothetical protein
MLGTIVKLGHDVPHNLVRAGVRSDVNDDTSDDLLKKRIALCAE